MYDERLEKLVFQSPIADLEHHAANHDEPDVGPPEVPPPKNPFDRPWDDRRNHGAPSRLWDVFLIILAVAVWSFVGGMTLEVLKNLT